MVLGTILILIIFLTYLFTRTNKEDQKRQSEELEILAAKKKDEDDKVREDLPCLSGFKFGQTTRHLNEMGVSLQYLSSNFGTNLYVIEGQSAPIKNDLIESYFIKINEKLGITDVTGNFFDLDNKDFLMQHYSSLLKEKYRNAEIVIDDGLDLVLLLNEVRIQLSYYPKAILVYSLIEGYTAEQLTKIIEFKEQEKLGI
ncbi:hypothetical protein FHQ28_11705 [Pasteurellaceae bacterium USgator11]|nr:hypothetical protein FHQ20_10950 [Pasteurellaceae bacterium USgator41]TNG98825.1 hypothetical protein FHQ28_11705 [Pasteurellaceae bacterium USgator11]